MKRIKEFLRWMICQRFRHWWKTDTDFDSLGGVQEVASCRLGGEVAWMTGEGYYLIPNEAELVLAKAGKMTLVFADQKVTSWKDTEIEIKTYGHPAPPTRNP